jgi:hypothetical protein
MTNIRKAPGTQLYWSGATDPSVMPQIINLGIRTVISLDTTQFATKGLNVYELKKRGINYIPNNIEPNSPAAGANSLRNIFINEVPMPIYIHCKLGQDRCGFAIALWGMYREKFAPNVNAEYKNLPRPCKLIKHVEKLTGYGKGISPGAKQEMNRVIGCGNLPELDEEIQMTPEEAARTLEQTASIANTIICIAKKKSIVDLGNKLQVSTDIVEDIHESIQRTLDGIKNLDIKGPEISKDVMNKIKDYTDNLALLCNMILNDKDYDEEEKLKTIIDINELTAVDVVRENYDMQGGPTAGARGDAGPAGDNVRYFNYIDPEAEIYPPTNIRARKRIWKALIKSAAKLPLCKKCLRNPCSCDPCDCGSDCPLCGNKEDQNDAFLGGGPIGSPTAEGLPSGQDTPLPMVNPVPEVGMHDNYSGISSTMNQPSGTPGAPNGASPVMPAQPNLSS